MKAIPSEEVVVDPATLERESCTVATRTRAPFIKGPIPLEWICTAHSLGGSAGAVGVILYYFSGLRKSQVFKVGLADIARIIGVSRDTVRRGLRALEDSGLVDVSRVPGNKAQVRIVEAVATAPSTKGAGQ
jgi:DNA-binding transcriptional ArsR family regulator